MVPLGGREDGREGVVGTRITGLVRFRGTEDDIDIDHKILEDQRSKRREVGPGSPGTFRPGLEGSVPRGDVHEDGGVKTRVRESVRGGQPCRVQVGHWDLGVADGPGALEVRDLCLGLKGVQGKVGFRCNKGKSRHRQLSHCDPL